MLGEDVCVAVLTGWAVATGVAGDGREATEAKPALGEEKLSGKPRAFHSEMRLNKVRAWMALRPRFTRSSAASIPLDRCIPAEIDYWCYKGLKSVCCGEIAPTDL